MEPTWSRALALLLLHLQAAEKATGQLRPPYLLTKALDSEPFGAGQKAGSANPTVQ